MSFVKRIVLLLSASLLLNVISCQHGQSAPTISVASPKWITVDDQTCSTDTDCVLVSADCCGCTQGGKQTAVNLSSSKKVAAERAVYCSDTFCVQVISKHPSCQAEAKCQNGLCVPAI